MIEGKRAEIKITYRIRVVSAENPQTGMTANHVRPSPYPAPLILAWLSIGGGVDAEKDSSLRA